MKRLSALPRSAVLTTAGVGIFATFAVGFAPPTPIPSEAELPVVTAVTTIPSLASGALVTVAATTTSLSSLETARAKPTELEIPLEQFVDVERLPSSEVVSPPPAARPTIPLAEAKERGLWGRPVFAGCEESGVRSPDEFNQALSQSDWPVAQWESVCRVSFCESRWNPRVYNTVRVRGVWTHHRGYMQIQDYSWVKHIRARGWTLDDMFDGVKNLDFAYWLWSEVYGSKWTTAGWDCAGRA